ncbi:MAG: transposase of ISGsu5 [Gemmataceae bacterium]|nr:transposase of ISGsu5 [Gemmataceae bacterium]
MRTYKTPHAYYCGVDLHARSLSVNVLDDTGRTRLEQDLPANPAAFLDAVKPYRDGLVVGCECLFAWYWLADLCEREAIPFVLQSPVRGQQRRRLLDLSRLQQPVYLAPGRRAGAEDEGRGEWPHRPADESEPYHDSASR